VDITTHISALEDEGTLLAEAAAKAGLDAQVPSCPDWQVRDLVQHVGQVHRWAHSYVSTGRTTPPDANDSPATPPGDDDLLDWFNDGHRALVTALREAPGDLDCWAFLAAPSPRAFWARRQAHETAIHRADAQLAAGMRPDYDAAFAADGTDELLLGFLARPRGRLVSDPRVRLGLRADDTGDVWTMTIGPESRDTVRAAQDADCTVTGRAADLYQLLWNRGDATACKVEGDSSLLELWRDNAKITWR
jgi:uncharacterized protein (TIGR03083 family)